MVKSWKLFAASLQIKPTLFFPDMPQSPFIDRKTLPVKASSCCTRVFNAVSPSPSFTNALQPHTPTPASQMFRRSSWAELGIRRNSTSPTIKRESYRCLSFLSSIYRQLATIGELIQPIQAAFEFKSDDQYLPRSS